MLQMSAGQHAPFSEYIYRGAAEPPDAETIADSSQLLCNFKALVLDCRYCSIQSTQYPKYRLRLMQR